MAETEDKRVGHDVSAFVLGITKQAIYKRLGRDRLSLSDLEKEINRKETEYLNEVKGMRARLAAVKSVPTAV